ncbi:MAG: amidohydrolase family protein, partial [Myxococcota bacterium]
LPVPYGFVITTPTCREYFDNGNTLPTLLEQEYRVALDLVEKKMGARFGDPDNPLLFSVRSGAPISMPGMMNTILNLGINDEIVKGLQGYIARNFESLKLAIKMNVKIAMGSDAVLTGFGENTRELEWFVKAGMTPEQALQTATKNAAELLGKEKELGAIAPGYFADIVAVQGDPLSDIDVVVNKVLWVMKDGNWDVLYSIVSVVFAGLIFVAASSVKRCVGFAMSLFGLLLVRCFRGLFCGLLRLLWRLCAGFDDVLLDWLDLAC